MPHFKHVLGERTLNSWFIVHSTKMMYYANMKHAILLVGLSVTSILAASADAQVRELERSELRENVRSGKSMSMSRLLGAIAARVDAEVVDVRGFEAGGIYYRVLLKRPNGKLSVAIVDARTGRFMSGRSDVAKDVMAAARENNGKGKGKSRSAARSNASGNSNAGGNGNSRNGNSGGNGNGGSNGNGGGNGGGNGNSGGGGGGGGNSGGGGGGGGGNAGGGGNGKN